MERISYVLICALSVALVGRSVGVLKKGSRNRVVLLLTPSISPSCCCLPSVRIHCHCHCIGIGIGFTFLLFLFGVWVWHFYFFITHDTIHNHNTPQHSAVVVLSLASSSTISITRYSHSPDASDGREKKTLNNSRRSALPPSPYITYILFCIVVLRHRDRAVYCKYKLKVKCKVTIQS